MDVRTRLPAALARRAAWAAACLLAVVACDGPAGPRVGDGLDVRMEGGQVVYLSAPGDHADTLWMEGYYRWLKSELGASPAQRLEFHKYRDREHLRRVTGRSTNGFAEPGTVRFHTLWPRDNHEIVHAVVVLEMGHPPALFNEGIAVAHHTDPAAGVLDARWNGRNVHAIAAEHLAAGRVPALSAVLESRDFFAHDEGFVYPLAGSFVRFLIDRSGMGPLRAYLRGSTFGDGAAKTRAELQAAYGITLDAAWSEWRAFLAVAPG